jgi:putative intracellular protease/amidase
MIRRKTSVTGLLVLVILIASVSGGCQLFGTNVKSFTAMTPKEKSTFFMGVYNKNFDETMAVAIKPTLTEDEKKMVRVKKTILTNMKPVISAYDAIAVSGGTPSAEAEKALLGLVDQLVAATIPTAGVK